MGQNNCTFSNIEKFVHEIENESVRSLHILRDIEDTITIINRLTAQLNADARYAEIFIDRIKKLTTKSEIDPENIIIANLEKAQSFINDIYNVLVLKRDSSRNDVRLSEDDGIEQVYTEAIGAAADLHSNLNDLRWHVMEHDADLSQTSKAYTDVKELLKDLAS
ncbi:hypothetical protein SAMN05216326_12531 [Nitrosomonas marina]|uniref:Uncharacterized protein n=1 Tax=Nitrosomonas marina TaxID=917 RepID=A0A1I0E744_9PROT|nr:hypothetical protein [Nitrosomonas marina]SET40657.1 hypothetical protein SAMN05216326_12531 [Nitrosomonas marina]